MTNFQKYATVLSTQNGILVDGVCQSYTYQETHLLQSERIVYIKHLTKETTTTKKILKNASELIVEEDSVKTIHSEIMSHL